MCERRHNESKGIFFPAILVPGARYILMKNMMGIQMTEQMTRSQPITMDQLGLSPRMPCSGQRTQETCVRSETFKNPSSSVS
ncbi:hypothetical protein EYF80_040645 [Liparis tanakae]|uniref:Uncharacterized protein n=1 Tax=Liparis tanakae TaxID=230148 RepID=A0A4Z2G6F2_9TELE|nr:hypothetical protein EYF80_040645 [Liparis tanakae]